MILFSFWYAYEVMLQEMDRMHYLHFKGSEWTSLQKSKIKPPHSHALKF